MNTHVDRVLVVTDVAEPSSELLAAVRRRAIVGSRASISTAVARSA